jgi:COMPASS component SPP1
MIPQYPIIIGANNIADNDALAENLSEEEQTLIKRAAKERASLEEESAMCRKMLTLIELAQDRRRAAITAGRFSEDICGYDQRLDTISARDAFAAFAKSPEGEAIFATSKLGDPLGEEDELTRGMCERKRCKAHAGWGKMLVLGLKHQIREMQEQAEEVGEQERIVRDAAGERWMRKKAEKNWVEVL